MQSYIDQFDSVIKSGDEKEAGRLVSKTLNAFQNDFSGLSKGLTRSGTHVLNTSGLEPRMAGTKWNNLKNLESLREKLKYEWDKLQEKEDIKDSKITVINHGYEASVQIQQVVNFCVGV